MIRRLEAEAVHDGRRAGPGAIAVDGLQRRIQLGERQGRVAPSRHLRWRRHAAQFRVAVQHEFDRGPRARGDFLFDVGNLDGRRQVDVAAVGV